MAPPPAAQRPERRPHARSVGGADCAQACYSGKEAVIRFWQAFFARWPNVRMDVEEVFGFGERAVLRPRYAWADPAGSQAHLRGADIFRVSGNAIREHLTYARR